MVIVTDIQKMKNIIVDPKELIRIGITVASEISIPLEKAIELCRVHRGKHGVRLFSQCWGCVRFSKEVPEKMCFYKPPNNDGCKIVNKEFEASN